MTARRSLWGALGLAGCVGLLFVVGSFWAFSRGGNDFNVFYEAWRLVLSGWGTEIYKATPDRFLYAPGFAWILAPLGVLPRDVALAFWCLAKAGLFAAMIWAFAARFQEGEEENRWHGVALACAGALIVARPLLIDLQYGQVNAIILCLSMLALLSHFDRKKPSRWDGVRWFALAVFAVAKLYALPLLAVPWFSTRGVQERKLYWERVGILVAVGAMLALPALSLGASGWVDLFVHWREALYDRGLPTESHNQSFLAFLHHYFSGAPTHVIARGSEWLPLGWKALSPEAIARLGLGWSLAWGGFLLGWILSSSARSHLAWIAVMIGLLIVPSHLVWKPYFVMTYPLLVIALARAERLGAGLRDFRAWAPFAALFAVMSLSGFDFVGEWLGARIEAASPFLFTHVILLAWVARAEREEAGEAA